MVDAEKILKSTNLPTLPAVAMELLEHARNPSAEISDYVRTIKSDPAITAKILKTANSSFFSLRSKATTLERAIPVLGTNTVSTLALGFTLVESSSGSGNMAALYRSYWLQSVVQAIVAETLAQQVKKGMRSEFFLIGLMLDLGRLAMLKTIPAEYRDLLGRYQPTTQDLQQLELDEFGFNHIEIGTKLMQKWELPEQIVEAVSAHHTDFNQASPQEVAGLSPLVMGAAFSAAAGDFFCTDAQGKSLNRLRQLASLFYGFDEIWLDSFIASARERIDESANLFSADSREISEPTELMAQANEQLATMALMAQIASTQNLEQQMQVVQEFKQLETRNKELETQAVTDAMTGVFNRRFFEETLKKEVSRCQRYSLSSGVLFCDVDNFKQINDRFGHACGDMVLKTVAQVMNNAVRTSDTMARYGGEEFVALLIGADQAGVACVAERIRTSVETTVFEYENTRIPVTVSVGGTVTTPLPGPLEMVCKQLMLLADEAMYSAKQNGRNRVEFRDYCNAAIVS